MLRTLLLLAAFLLAPLWGTDSFTSATAGTTVSLAANPLGFTQTGTYQVSGTFVATLQWQFSVDGRNWATYNTYTAPVGPIVFSAPGFYRFNCSAYTSGTAVGTVTLAPKLYQQQYASNGTLLFQVDDSGVTAFGLGSGAVSSVNGLTGSVVFAAGSNITLTPAGNTITIASTGGGGITFNALGDTVYGGTAAATTILSGNTTTTKKFWTQTGTGSASAAPGWNTVVASDVPNLPGTIITSGAVSPQFGGTGLDSSTAANGSVLIGTGSGLALTTLTAGSGVTITNGPGTISIAATGTSGVSTLNSLSGALNITAGSGITVTPSGSSIAIAATGGGGSGFPVSTSTYAVQDATDATKQQLWNLASSTTGTNLTLKGQQSTSQTLAFPNITGADTLPTLGLAQTFTGTNTFNTVTPVVITQTAASSGSPNALKVTGAAHNTSTNAEITDVLFDLSATETIAAGGLNPFRCVRIIPRTIAAAAATSISNAATFVIDSQPLAGANVTLSTPYALRVVAGNTALGGVLTVSSTIIGGGSLQTTGVATLGAIGGAFAGNVIAGEQTGSTASAGQVGEVLSVNTSTYTNYTTTATYQQVATLTITAGAWDVTAIGTVSSNGATLTATGNAIWALGTTTASATGTTEGLGDIVYLSEGGINVTSGKQSVALHRVINLSTSTAYFLNSQAAFSLGNPQFVGSIVATRIR